MVWPRNNTYWRARSVDFVTYTREVNGWARLCSRSCCCWNRHVNRPSVPLVRSQQYPTVMLQLSSKKSLPSYKGWVILTIRVNSLTFKLYLNLKENMKQKLMANVTTVSVVYKTTVWPAQTRHEWGEKLRGTWRAHRANLLNWICHIRVSFNFCTYVQELSLEETKLQT